MLSVTECFQWLELYCVQARIHTLTPIRAHDSSCHYPSVAILHHYIMMNTNIIHRLLMKGGRCSLNSRPTTTDTTSNTWNHHHQSNQPVSCSRTQSRCWTAPGMACPLGSVVSPWMQMCAQLHATLFKKEKKIEEVSSRNGHLIRSQMGYNHISRRHILSNILFSFANMVTKNISDALYSCWLSPLRQTSNDLAWWMWCAFGIWWDLT